MLLTRRSLALASLAPVLAACGMGSIAEPLSAANAAADQLAARLPPEARGKRFGATTFVEADDINTVSPVGRLVAEQIANRFVSRHGISLAEIRMANALIMDSRAQGELLLSRSAREHARIAGVDFFLLGTVSRIGPRSYVNARIVRVTDSTVVSATSFVVSA